MTKSEQILLVGCGKMGGALIEGWIGRGVMPSAIFVIDPMQPDVPTGVSIRDGFEAIPSAFEPTVVVLAVKPQVMDKVLVPYADVVRSETVFLSIAAGRTIASFEAILGGDARIVRAMPNTPAAVGRGITVLAGNANVSGAQREACESLMAAVGKVAWIDDERLIDAVTGVSGSGPAYVFHLVEAMAAAGVTAGLAPALAMQLARETVVGGGELLGRSAEPAAALRENVTSPGGTTAAALEVLMSEDGLTELMTRAILRATERSRELAG
ncbi:MAG: pyrroline-5-carboxylate reductase [Alphaproteobacteria bacterium]|nr:pyrroline-5-carboxylate reductase [Alphaproteobacteria bacterium]HCP01079.1 pyrroline-5-carboxylate reductase [Rhodospirillaceae bacterium]